MFRNIRKFQDAFTNIVRKIAGRKAEHFKQVSSCHVIIADRPPLGRVFVFSCRAAGLVSMSSLMFFFFTL